MKAHPPLPSAKNAMTTIGSHKPSTIPSPQGKRSTLVSSSRCHAHNGSHGCPSRGVRRILWIFLTILGHISLASHLFLIWKSRIVEIDQYHPIYCDDGAVSISASALSLRQPRDTLTGSLASEFQRNVRQSFTQSFSDLRIRKKTSGHQEPPCYESASTRIQLSITANDHFHSNYIERDAPSPAVVMDASTPDATVVGMATGYGVKVFERFVGSLRHTGYQGHIILGVAPDVKDEVLEYFAYRNVTPKIMNFVPCTYTDKSKSDDIFQKTQCADPYPNIKIRWSRFPLIRDWLQECESCTGPVLVTDVRDTFFQANPFGPGLPASKTRGLQVYAEHPLMTTRNWLTKWPIGECKGKDVMTWNEPMLCSGTTTAENKNIMIKYLKKMYEEMKVWITNPKCRFDINGDDQSIHNYLFYSGQLEDAVAIPFRSNGIVNTVGHWGSQIMKEHRRREMAKDPNLNATQANHVPFEGADPDRNSRPGAKWIGTAWNVTDEHGLFTENDGKTISRVVHQYDRFSFQFTTWLYKQPWMNDPIPDKWRNERESSNEPNKPLEHGVHILEEQMKGYTEEYFLHPQTSTRYAYPDDGWAKGILSEKPDSFFHKIQKQIDDEAPAIKCARYEGMTYDPSKQRKPRRIFFGSLIANEPWETIEIVAAEARGIFAGIVLVESNRTQTLHERKFGRLHHGKIIGKVFGTENVQVRAFVSEDPKIKEMNREHLQRQEILIGWKEMGMGPDDIGYLGDLDETFTRDFLRALQICEYVALDHDKNRCEAKISGRTQTYEGSPKCIVKKSWWHPEAVLGACIQHIGDEAQHPLPPRNFTRRHRDNVWGLGCNYDGMKENATLWDNKMYPLFDSADFRRRCGKTVSRKQLPNSKPWVGRHTGYHFHNWFIDIHTIRHKYLTYGHPDEEAMQKHLKDLHPDTATMNQCALNDKELLMNQKYEFEMATPASYEENGFVPIYFQDDEYLEKRHNYLQYMIYYDETQGHGSTLLQPWNHSFTKKFQLPTRSRNILAYT